MVTRPMFTLAFALAAVNAIDREKVAPEYVLYIALIASTSRDDALKSRFSE
jgi:hypothetical protein